jgi:hypothetical protein
MGETEFLRDPETGVLYAYKGKELVGPIVSMGDPADVPSEPSRNLWMEAHGNG